MAASGLSSVRGHRELRAALSMNATFEYLLPLEKRGWVVAVRARLADELITPGALVAPDGTAILVTAVNVAPRKEEARLVGLLTSDPACASFVPGPVRAPTRASRASAGGLLGAWCPPARWRPDRVAAVAEILENLLPRSTGDAWGASEGAALANGLAEPWPLFPLLVHRHISAEEAACCLVDDFYMQVLWGRLSRLPWSEGFERWPDVVGELAGLLRGWAGLRSRPLPA